jgi:hypothetical protein
MSGTPVGISSISRPASPLSLATLERYAAQLNEAALAESWGEDHNEAVGIPATFRFRLAGRHEVPMR